MPQRGIDKTTSVRPWYPCWNGRTTESVGHSFFLFFENQPYRWATWPSAPEGSS